MFWKIHSIYRHLCALTHTLGFFMYHAHWNDLFNHFNVQQNIDNVQQNLS
ncbi:exported hypothetical protein [Nitrosomonas mobilis]|uniref:Uncharacterized protein n=1 Tax=Nitrosomonas mobilis TaxID=51642 RepID=A0A1G5SK57_9PROT|nr:exported hypothetical protein [Nitrosomonas mobilis]